MEKNFGISFKEDDMDPENFETLQAMLETVEMKKSLNGLMSNRILE